MKRSDRAIQSLCYFSYYQAVVLSQKDWNKGYEPITQYIEKREEGFEIFYDTP